MDKSRRSDEGASLGGEGVVGGATGRAVFIRGERGTEMAGSRAIEKGGEIVRKEGRGADNSVNTSAILRRGE